MNEVYQLLVAFNEDSSNYSIAQEINTLSNENPLVFLDQLAEIISNESCSNVIKILSFQVMNNILTNIRQSVDISSLEFPDELISRIKELCLSFIHQFDCNHSQFPGIALGGILNLKYDEELVSACISELLSTDNLSCINGITATFKELFSYITFSNFAPFQEITQYVLSFDPQTYDSSIFSHILSLFIYYSKNVIFSTTPQIIKSFFDKTVAFLQHEELISGVLDFYHFIAEKKPFAAVQFFPHYFNIFHIFIGNINFQKNILQIMIDLFQSISEDPQINIPDINEIAIPLLEGVFSNVNETEDVFSNSLEFITTFIDIIPNDVVDQILQTFIEAKLSEGQNPLVYNLIFHLFKCSIPHNSFLSFDFNGIIQNQEILQIASDEHIFPYFGYFLSSYIKYILSDCDEINESFVSVIELVHSFLQQGFSEDSLQIINSKLKLAVNLIQILPESDEYSEQFANIIQFINELSLSVNPCEITFFKYMNKLMKVIHDCDFVDMLISSTMQQWVEFKSPYVINTIFVFVDRFTNRFIGIINDLVPPFLEDSGNVESSSESESLLSLCFFLRKANEKYEQFVPATVEIINNLLSADQLVQNPQLLLAVVCLIDEIISSQFIEQITSDHVEFLKAVFQSEEQSWRIRGAALLAYDHLHSRTKFETDFSEIMPLLSFKDQYIEDYMQDEASDMITAMLHFLIKMLRIYPEAESIITALQSFIDVISNYEYIQSSILTMFLQVCIELCDSFKEFFISLIQNNPNILRLVHRAKTTSETDNALADVLLSLLNILENSDEEQND